MNEGSLSHSKSLWPGASIISRPPGDAEARFPAAMPPPGRSGRLPLPPKVAPFPASNDPAEEIKRLGQELATYRQSIDQWIKAEAAWSNQRRLFKAMTENVTDMIVLLDRHGKRVWNNPAYSHALGYPLEELAGTYAFAQVHPDDLPAAESALHKAIAEKKSQQAEYRLKKKDGDHLDVLTELVPVITPEGQIESLVLMAHDVTETKQLREAVALASTQLSASSMLDGMARDFDRLLTSMLGNLTIARTLNGTQNHALGQRLVEMERSLQRARDLVEQMFSLSPEAERSRELTALEPVVQEAIQGVLRGTFVRAEYLFARNLPELELDREGLGHAVSNIVTNSLQAMDKGVIRVTADYVPQEHMLLRTEVPVKPGNYICLRIQDQGHGMSEKTLLHAMEPYFTTRQGAQGLGLATALSAIQRMGGTILLDSTEMVGTTAYIYLPAPALSTATAAPARPHASMTTALPTAKRRILLMDDEQMILDIVSRMLFHLGYEVATCTDGAQAIAAFAKAKSSGAPFDVVLMDLVVPNGVGGQDAVHTIRKIDPAAKVIASSGHLEHPVMMEYKKFGFTVVLEKPYKLERLQQVIEAVLKGRAV